ncbi:MAG TPA: peptidoglycan DD-metalloendopeptidase family protein, partial [Spirochaetota bacterium]|nr:peptidoglycan DD-metalloendopeptidase family protein [Spirochaetota bacterium]
MQKLFVLSLFLIIFNISLFTLSYKIHFLKEGETLWRVSKIYNIPLDKLCEYNKINDVTKVKKGAKIKIPEKNDISKKENNTKIVNNEVNEKKISDINNNYFDFNLPIKGDVKPYVTSYFRGIIIFSENDNNVLSVADGEVNFVDNITGYGKTVIIKSSDGYIFTYSGFSDYLVNKGDKVGKNSKLGISG